MHHIIEPYHIHLNKLKRCRQEAASEPIPLMCAVATHHCAHHNMTQKVKKQIDKDWVAYGFVPILVWKVNIRWCEMSENQIKFRVRSMWNFRLNKSIKLYRRLAFLHFKQKHYNSCTLLDFIVHIYLFLIIISRGWTYVLKCFFFYPRLNLWF